MATTIKTSSKNYFNRIRKYLNQQHAMSVNKIGFRVKKYKTIEYFRNIYYICITVL